MKTQTNSGFTLIEILIVTAIAVILIGAGSVYLSGFHSEGQADSQAQQITTLLQAAQEKSRGRQNDSRWGVYITNSVSGQATYALYQVDEEALSGGCEGACGTPDESGVVPGTILERGVLPTGVSFSVPATGVNQNIIFAKSTGLPATATTIVLSATGSQTLKTIYVSANGQIEYRTSVPEEVPNAS